MKIFGEYKTIRYTESNTAAIFKMEGYRFLYNPGEVDVNGAISSEVESRHSEWFKHQKDKYR